MKKWLSILLALTLAMTAFSAFAEGAGAPPGIRPESRRKALTEAIRPGIRRMVSVAATRPGIRPAASAAGRLPEAALPV